MLVELGHELYSARKRRGETLQTVAEGAKISTAYLQKLENGKVNAPSPHVLRRLAGVLELPYLLLMTLAAYLPEEFQGQSAALVPDALLSETLSEEEWRSVLVFVRFLKEARVKPDAI